MIRFGTGGWRAVMGDDFTKYNVKKVATALCALIAEEGKGDMPVVIGYDRRFLSAPAAGWFSDVLTSYGIDVIAMNRSVPTPLVMFIVKEVKLWEVSIVTFPAYEATSATARSTGGESKALDAWKTRIKERLANA